VTCCLLVILLPTDAHAQTLVWVRQFGESPYDIAHDAVADSSGVFIVGDVSEGLGGEGPLGQSDAFIQRYTGGGVLQWTRLWGTRRVDFATGVAAAKRWVFVGGTTWDRKSDAFIASYTSDGHLRWSTTFGTPAYDSGDSIAANHTGVYEAATVGGSSRGGASNRDPDILLRRYTLQGELVWAQRVGTHGYDFTPSVALDGKGHLYLAGATEGEFPSEKNLGGADLFVQKYAVSGRLRWTREFGTPQADAPGGSAAGPGGFYLAASSRESLAEDQNAGHLDGFLAKLGRHGARRWTARVGSPGDDAAHDVSLSGRRLFLTGTTDGTLKGQPSADLNDDAFLAEYGLDGARIGLVQFGSPNDDEAFGVGAAYGRAFVAGSTSGVFEGQTQHGDPTDGFVAKIT
jgi:hypothetical protein